MYPVHTSTKSLSGITVPLTVAVTVIMPPEDMPSGEAPRHGLSTLIGSPSYGAASSNVCCISGIMTFWWPVEPGWMPSGT
jgi:hypothetical protein